jgi:hypothetical protein
MVVQLLEAQATQKDKTKQSNLTFVIVQATVKKLSDTSSYAQDFVVWLN